MNDGLLPSEGWLNQCATHQSLHDTGLTFLDDASLVGAISPNALKEIWFTAFHTDGEASPPVVTRLNLHLYINTYRTTQTRLDAQPQVSTSANKAIAYYEEYYNRHQLSHAEAIKGMNTEFGKMKVALDKQPTASNGYGWGILGALHMNTHKLLENVLLEAEHYLGFSLTFGGKAAEFAESNLEGCYAKRQLEAAKFIWMNGMEKTIKGIQAMMMGKEEEEGGGLVVEQKEAASKVLLDQAVVLFERAVGKKDGWGWGVNNGEAWLGLASSKLLLVHLLGRDEQEGEENSAPCMLVEKAAVRNPRLPWTVFLQEYCNTDRSEKEDEEITQFILKTTTSTLAIVRPKPRVEGLPPLPWPGISVTS